jgi:holo-[acyl-carrier protein] synthase
MNLGLDIIEIARIRAALARHGGRFLRRIYTPREIEYCAGRVDSLAARFAAKEAVAKALGCGIGEISWTDIEILNDDAGAPILHLHGAAERLASEMGLRSWRVSLTHTRDTAAALVIGEKSSG